MEGRDGRALAALLAGMVVPTAGSWAQLPERWVLAGVGDNGSRSYVDRETLRREGGRVIVWERFQPAHPTRERGYTIYQNEYDCDRRTARLLTMISHRADGTVGERSDLPRTGPYQDPIAPETMAEHIFRLVCA